MTQEDMTIHAMLEDKIFDLELALLNIGGALLAPGSWGDDQRLHQHMYDTVKRVLGDTPFGDALGRREQQIQVRRSAAPAIDKVLDDLHSELARPAAAHDQVSGDGHTEY